MRCSAGQEDCGRDLLDRRRGRIPAEQPDNTIRRTAVQVWVRRQVKQHEKQQRPDEVFYPLLGVPISNIAPTYRLNFSDDKYMQEKKESEQFRGYSAMNMLQWSIVLELAFHFWTHSDIHPNRLLYFAVRSSSFLGRLRGWAGTTLQWTDESWQSLFWAVRSFQLFVVPSVA